MIILTIILVVILFVIWGGIRDIKDSVMYAYRNNNEELRKIRKAVVAITEGTTETKPEAKQEEKTEDKENDTN